LVIVNAAPVVSLMHLNIALSRALVNQRDHSQTNSKNKMRTGNFSSEVLYHLSPSHSISHSIEQFGTS